MPAPTFDLWRVAIVVTEWGHLLSLAALLPLLLARRGSATGHLGGALGLGAALLAISPLLRALPVAAQLPAQLADIFGAAEPREAEDAPPRPAPLVAADLVRGVAVPPVAPRTLAFAAPGGTELLLDLYQPPSQRAPAPIVLMIHGGAWEGGDKSELPALNRYLAARGYAVAAPNYRLAPGAPFPAAYDDVRAAIAFLKRRAAELRLDATRLVLIGRSAGGQLALLAAYSDDDPAIRGAVSLYGPTDLAYGYANPTNPRVLDSRATLGAYLGGRPAELPEVYRLASPISFVGAATPPTLLVHGPRDELVHYAHSERLAAALAAAGRPHLLLRLPWATHACDFNFSGPCGQITTYAVEHFLAAVMK